MVRIIFLVGGFILLCACQDTKHSGKYFDKAWDFIEHNPDSTLFYLDGLEFEKLAKGQQAEYASLKTWALDKKYIDIQSDSLISIAVKYYAKNGNDRENALALYLQGRIYTNMDSISLAAKSYLQAYDRVLKTDNDRLTGLICHYLALLYDAQYNLLRASDFHDKAIRSFKKTDDVEGTALVINAKAKNSVLRNEFQEAIEYYEHTKDIFQEINSIDNYVLSATNISSIYYLHLQNPEKALSELFETYHLFLNDSIPLRQYPLLGYIYYNSERLDSARYYLSTYLKKAENLAETRRATINKLLSQLEEKEGDFESAHKYLSNYSSQKEEIHENEINNLLVEIEKKYENQKLQTQNALIKSKSKYQLFITALIILLLIFILLKIRRTKRIVASKNEELETQIDFLNSKLDDVEPLEQKLSQMLSEKSERERQLRKSFDQKIADLRRLAEITILYENDKTTFHKKIKDYIHVKTKDQTFDYLTEVTNNQYFGVVDYLNENYPDLNENDINLCCLICLGFNNNEISLLYNHTNYNSVFTVRYKLRKKLGLSPRACTLETFLKEILCRLEKRKIEGNDLN